MIVTLSDIRHKRANRETIRVDVFPLARQYTDRLVNVICTAIDGNVSDQNSDNLADGKGVPDVAILHITELSCLNSITSQGYPFPYLIVLSGETWELNPQSPIQYFIRPYQGACPFRNVYYPFLYMSLDERKQSELQSELQSETKQSDLQSELAKQDKKWMAFMYHQNYEHRNAWFHKLSAYKRVDGLGRACNNVDRLSTRFVHNESETYNDIAVRLYRDYSFVLAIENTWKEGYMTEKLLNPILAGSIPLYWGHPSAFRYINKNRVIYLPDYETEELMKRLDELETNPDLYQEMVTQSIYTEDGDPERVFRKYTEAVTLHFS